MPVAGRITWLFLGSMVFLSCSSAPRYTSPGKRVAAKRATPAKPAAGRFNDPAPESIRIGLTLTGIASYYGKDFHGKMTANGEVFDMYGVTAAHRTLPLNTIIKVTNLETKRYLIVRVNDRGPYIRGRILDLSYGAAKKLGFLSAGTTKVRIEVLELGDDEYMQHLD